MYFSFRGGKAAAVHNRLMVVLSRAPTGLATVEFVAVADDWTAEVQDGSCYLALTHRGAYSTMSDVIYAVRALLTALRARNREVKSLYVVPACGRRAALYWRVLRTLQSVEIEGDEMGWYIHFTSWRP